MFKVIRCPVCQGFITHTNDQRHVQCAENQTNSLTDAPASMLIEKPWLKPRKKAGLDWLLSWVWK